MNTPEMSSCLPLSDLIGQRSITERLKVISNHCRNAGEAAGHMIFCGPDGLGQTAFIKAFANSIGTACQYADAQQIVQSGDLTAILTNIKKHQFLVFSNAEAVKPIFWGKLAEALRHYQLIITIGQGPAARDHLMDLHPFTAIFRVSDLEKIPDSVRKAIPFVFKFQSYSNDEMLEICRLHAKRLGFALDQASVEAILAFASGKPSVAVETLERAAHLTDSAMDISAALLALGINMHPKVNGSITRDSLQGLSGVDFERLVCDLLTSMRFLTELTKVSGDGGIDIIARLNQPIIGGNYFFQCKRFAPDNLVGEPQLRDFYGAVMSQRQALKAVFVTTSDFTPQARNFGEKVGIELVNGALLSQLLKNRHPNSASNA